MSATDHADQEALSAFVDGEAPEWADHVAACEACRAAAARLGAVSAALLAPVAPPQDADRERAIAAALEAASSERRHEVQRARFARRWAPRSWTIPAAAAVVVAIMGLAGIVLSADRTTDDTTTFAGPVLDAKAESGVAGAAPNAPPADLGDVTDPGTLRARAGFPIGSEAAAGRSVSRANSGAASESSATNTGNAGAVVAEPSATSGSSGNTGAALAGPSAVSGGSGGAGGVATVSPPTTTLSQRSATPTPNAVGTRPCEERARTRDQSLGPVTYFATARRGDVPAYVLGFGDSSRFTLLLLAQSDCAELLRSDGP